MAQEVFVEDEKYPKALKEALAKLPKHLGPKKLYYKGKWSEDIFSNCLAVVGSRHLTSYGRKATEQIVTELALAGITIVSGFMYGGDEAAHKATVRAGGRTIAVMPCGINIVHPTYQTDLYDEILNSNGLVISEYAGDFLPTNFTFVQRDRIVAGLSRAVFVTEAALKSGSLITASYAQKYGIKIFALPGQITSEVSKGTLKLIKEGAEVVTCAGDILNFFKIKAEKKEQRTSAKASAGKCDALEKKIIEHLKREPMDADTIVRTLVMSSAKIGTTLTLMQLKGFINLEAGKYYIN
jgi:DNA processing protein